MPNENIYIKGKLASEEHRYADPKQCHDEAMTSYNQAYPPPSGGEPVEPLRVEYPEQGKPTTTIYSWRNPNTDVEMRFIVINDLGSPEIIEYYRINTFLGDDEKDLNAAIQPNALGSNSVIIQKATIDYSKVARGKKLIWRAIIKKNGPLLGKSIGLTPNPPYPP